MTGVLKQAPCAPHIRPGRVVFALRVLSGNSFHGGEHSRAWMTAGVFKKLFLGGCDRDLVIEPQLGGRSQRRKIFHRRAKDADVGWMRFRPTLECGNPLPPALPV